MAGDNREPGVIYREHSYYGPVLWALILGLMLLYAVVLTAAVVKRKYDLASYMGAVTLLLLALLANFWRLTFVITAEEVVFGFGLVKKRLKMADVKSCEPYTLTFGNYLGYGIRLGRDRTIAYNTRNGPGVKLEVEGAGRAYVLSLKNPARVCRLLEEIAGRK